MCDETGDTHNNILHNTNRVYDEYSITTYISFYCSIYIKWI